MQKIILPVLKIHNKAAITEGTETIETEKRKQMKPYSQLTIFLSQGHTLGRDSHFNKL